MFKQIISHIWLSFRTKGPVTQLHYGTIYPEIASDSTGQGFSLKRCTPSPSPRSDTTSHKPWLLPVLLRTCKSEVPTTFSLDLINLLEQHTELIETFYLSNYWFI